MRLKPQPKCSDVARLHEGEHFHFGWNRFGHKVAQLVCHISLEPPYDVRTINSMPAYVEHGAACVVGNTLYAVGIGNDRKQLSKWNSESGWVK